MLLGSLLILFLLGSAAPAGAHAALRSSDPEDGSVVKSAPRHVTLTFTESVGLLEDSFRIYGPDNRRVSLGDPEHAKDASDTARVELPGDLADGTYTVAWRVVSADSHPVSGAFTFSVGKPSPTAPAVPATPDEHPVTASLYDTARYLAYIAAALLIGVVAFAALCRPPDTRPLRLPLLTGWWTLLASTLVLLILRAPYENGTSPATALDPSAVTRALTGRPGLALLARLALVLLTAVVLLRLSRRRTPDRTPPAHLAAGTALAVGLALTWAAAEHASAGIQVPLAMTSSVLHLLATACWLGGLTALLLTLYRAQRPTPPATVVRFSRLAFTSVTVLAVTGVYQSWRGLGSWPALTETQYGRTLLVKLALVAALLLVAGLSRRWTTRLATNTSQAAVRERVPELVGAPGSAPTPPDDTPPPPPAPDPHRRALRRSVLVEVAVATVVLLVTTVLTSTLPARAEAEAASGETGATAPVAGLPGSTTLTVPYDVGTPNGTGRVQLTLDPGRVGENGVQAVVFGADNGLIAVPELRMTFTLKAKDVGPIDANLTDRGGYWATNDLTLPLDGTWTMKLTIRTTEVDQVTETRQVRISR
ncbi:copper resistance protein CopC/CopD [Streptomyces sp. 15-116A]|uniref:copper resistance CopC/CopD family protein n=1 Tax=Streptomyces sp. 15-116A TaxID=2259035 RepID=UPI0021B32ADD|nr:copper resistance protein CopC/CopD [Streptomyces sp. 15-116A]MCT7354762.1 copper resistance protein CopC/CopD [Streptomyces sp. 15-116A]